MSHGLAAHYKLSQSAQDLSGSGNHGKVCGSPLSVADRNGQPDAAMEFCFRGDHVLIATGDGECFQFVGTVDDVRIYNAALDAAIAELGQ